LDTKGGRSDFIVKTCEEIKGNITSHGGRDSRRLGRVKPPRLKALVEDEEASGLDAACQLKTKKKMRLSQRGKKKEAVRGGGIPISGKRVIFTNKECAERVFRKTEKSDRLLKIP